MLYSRTFLRKSDQSGKDNRRRRPHVLCIYKVPVAKRWWLISCAPNVKHMNGVGEVFDMSRYGKAGEQM